MSIKADILYEIGSEIFTIYTVKSNYHGQRSTKVVVGLKNGQKLEAEFVTERPDSFGGVEFATDKDIPGLVVSKIRQMLRGTAEL